MKARRPKRTSNKRKPGTAPGTLVRDPAATMSVLNLLAYGPDRLLEEKGISLDEAIARSAGCSVVWLNVTGLGDVELMEAIGKRFHLHRLALEDVLHTAQRPKVESYSDHLFMVFRAPEPRESCECVHTEQMSLFLLPGMVITFQEGETDCFGPVRDRIRNAVGRIRSSGPDYLAYALLDIAIDSYFPLIELLGERIEALEESVATSCTHETTKQMYVLRHDLMAIRRAVWPLRDMTNALVRDECSAISPETRVYLRDCYDHCVQIIDMVENFRELNAALMEMTISHASMRMNEVMKVLTIIATIFMPLTFIVGVYGMNFHSENAPLNMPELYWKFGYPFAMGLCLVCAVTMLIWFRRRKWL